MKLEKYARSKEGNREILVSEADLTWLLELSIAFCEGAIKELDCVPMAEKSFERSLTELNEALDRVKNRENFTFLDVKK